MHFSTHVIIGPGPLDPGAAEPLVSAAMAPFSEGLEAELVKDEEYGDYWTNPDSFWDWWQIGGRWKGSLVPDYNPDDDPAHKETCRICKGTGERPGGLEEFGQKWYDNCNGCNGCSGTGTSNTWPTQWRPHDGDIVTVASLLALLVAGQPHAVPYYVVMGGTFHQPGTDKWSADEDERKRLAEADAIAYRDLLNAALADGTISIDDRVVVVDCHS